MALSSEAIAGEALEVYDIWLNSYLTGDVKTYDHYLDDDYRFIGSTGNEEFLSRKETTQFFEATADQLAGKTDVRNSSRTVQQMGDLVFITQLLDGWFLNETAWFYYGRFRFTSVMRKRKNEWKFIYQHFSMPDSKAETGDTIGYDQVNKENVELRDAVKRRTVELENKNRELAIETALERTRTQSMLMQHSDEIKSISNVFHEQLLLLDIPSEFSYVWLPDESTNSHQFWASWSESKKGKTTLQSKQVTYPLDKSEPYTAACFAAWANPEVILEEFIPPSDIAGFFDVWQELLDGAQKLKAEFFPQGIYYSEAYMRYGCFGINIRRTLSDEEKNILKRFSIEFERAYTRFLDLQKAEAQAREAKIETALEKVRSRSLGMQKSDELQEVIQIVYEQFAQLGIEVDHTGFIIDYPTNEDMHIWLADRNGVPSEIRIPYFDAPHWNSFLEAKKNGGDFFVNHHDFEEKNKFYNTLFEIIPDLSDEIKTYYLECPGLDISTVLMDNVGLYIERFSGRPYTDADNKTLKRFGMVFQQAYTRFLDLQKAEAQAREARIETALEKVRSRSLAMHKSDELNEVVSVLFEKLKDLQIPFTAVGIATRIEGSKDLNAFVCGQNDAGLVITNYRLPYFDNPIPKDLYNALENQLDPFVAKYTKEEKDAFYEYVLAHTVEFRHLPEDIKHMIFESPTYTITHVAVKNAVFNVNDFEGKVLDEHEVDIIKRFARVFDQAYTRFLDLQKAEAQAREAQIEAALEKVRSRTMAMQKGEELKEVAVLLYKELIALGVTNFVTCGYVEIDENINRQYTWVTAPGGDTLGLFYLPLTGDATFDERYAAWKRQQVIFHQMVAGEVRSNHLEYAITTFNSKEAEEMVRSQFPDPTVFYCFNFSHGYLHLVTGSKLNKEEEILLARFTRVFEQTYTRFLDLQKAEARSKEGQIELALERIRSQVASMQESSDLFDIVVGMRTEFLALGHQADYFWHMRWLPDSYEMSMTSEDGSRIGMVISLPKFVHDEIPALAEWEKGEDPIYVLALDPEGAWDYIENMNTHGDYELADPNAPGKEDIEHIGGLTFIMARTTHGEIGYGLPGMVPEPPKDALDTLVRFAGVFDLAYKRFEDLKAAERQALMIREERDRLEIALNELHATQDQLVQQEKLASLGQLTAGIAHEIKNPLNFVNNFSEVSLELIEEALQEIAQIENNEHATESSELLTDIKSNLTKIHQHGTRANGIVSSMLQHSRGGSGKMEPTDLNALIKEYVNLAFHGMRAGKNPINVNIQLDLDEKVGNVNLIGEDFSRVVLNLSNNAFDAMREKAKIESGYTPKLTVRSKRLANSVEIQIEDNGPGIPDEIKDKILQPFFTTKKGTEGTGLGLSITHDIIKAHGGTIDIQSRPGETIFQIDLTA